MYWISHVGAVEKKEEKKKERERKAKKGENQEKEGKKHPPVLNYYTFDYSYFIVHYFSKCWMFSLADQGHRLVNIVIFTVMPTEVMKF